MTDDTQTADVPATEAQAGTETQTVSEPTTSVPADTTDATPSLFSELHTELNALATKLEGFEHKVLTDIKADIEALIAKVKAHL